jgi:hypothetical protein
MTRIGARDFEDMLQVSKHVIIQLYPSQINYSQCAIPCFEGLFPSPDDEHIMSLLYVLAY